MSDPSLSKIYLKRNVVFEYASALSILSMSVHALCLEQHDISGDSSSDTAEEATSPGFQAIWEELAAIISQTFSRIVAERTRNPTSAQTTAIAGGLLHTIIRCSAHLPPDSRDLGSLVAKTIPNIVRLLATKEGVYSLTNRYPKQFPSESGEDELNTLLDLVGTRSVLMAKACECIRESIKEGKRRVEASTQGAVQVIGAMCGSHEHRLRSTPEMDLEARFRTCSRCHCVSYCSSTCQEDDWNRLHARECKSFAEVYKCQRRNAEWTHFERWRDYVSDLYTLANKELSRGIYTTIPLPHDSRQPYDPNSTIFVWHIPSFDGRVTRKMVLLNDYHGICWKHINLGWEQRVRQMCQDVEESRGQSYVLVEGIFMHDAARCIFVLVKFWYDESPTDGRHYKAVDSLWRSG
ncbi:hypothetical protein FA13DRAFT_1519535 [Coprinellus micaceus]|uniref:MYND-type domain-containing protein n=1 Tax=Coprinellus micaceus TaxID=71717 RepID=A0A4Y7SLR3_COPMI|nr:hypothetical protein FA13DRAFT_1519535 [Coprinellus micaceus]